MSQFFVNGDGGVTPPEVATQYTTDFQADQITPNGIAIPSGNNLNVLGGSGIETYVDPNNGDNLFIKVKNSTTDTGQTIGVTTINLSLIDCSAIGTYFFTSQLAAFEATTPAGAGAQLYTTIISDGVNATVIDDTDAVAHRSPALAAINYQFTTSGTNALLQVTGAAGLTIDWGAITIYVYRG